MRTDPYQDFTALFWLSNATTSYSTTAYVVLDLQKKKNNILHNCDKSNIQTTEHNSGSTTKHTTEFLLTSVTMAHSAVSCAELNSVLTKR